MRHQFFFQPAFFNRRHFVIFSPGFGLILSAKVDVSGLDCQANRGSVPEKIGTDEIKVIQPTAHGKITAPIVDDALLYGVASGLELFDAVRPTAERRLQCGGAKVAAGPVVFGQDGQLADNQRQLAVARFLKIETNTVRVQRLDGTHRTVVETVLGVSLADQGFEGPDNIIGGDGCAIMPTGLWAQVKDYPGAVRGPFDGTGNQAIAGKRLISAGHQQRFH